jgi:metallophosphoesterase (TIGR00282 family)
MKTLRAVMIGDVVGEPGLEALEAALPVLLNQHNVDFVVVNGENVADGFGMTDAALKRILAAGADAVTSGNHVWEKRDFWEALNTNDFVLRPANYPAGTVGRGWLRIEKAGVSWIVINVQGREFMTAIDCPFRCFDSIMDCLGYTVSKTHSLFTAEGSVAIPGIFPIVLVDFHAESAREKEALAYYLDGRTSLVAGTHTHVQTADERVLPRGTAFITDLGMTGITNSVIGMDPAVCLDRMRKQVLYRMEPAGKSRMDKNGTTTELQALVQGVLAEIDGETGKALSIRRL